MRLKRELVILKALLVKDEIRKYEEMIKRKDDLKNAIELLKNLHLENKKKNQEK
jgi:hypothetical protein